MWFVVICGIIGIIICLVIDWINYKKYDASTFGFGVIGGLIGILLGLLASFVISAIVSCGVAETQVVNKTETQLVALEDNYQVNGRYYTHRGYYGEELKYTYLFETEKGITSNSVPAKNTYIKYIKENEKPKIETHTYNISNEILQFITLDGITQYDEYIIYVPYGTVLVEGEYKVDLQ